MTAPIHTLEQFQPLCGQTFEISDGSGALTATLVEATSLREGQGAGARSRQFSLVWRGPPGVRLDQRIYTLRHPSIGTLELFLVTVGKDADGMLYEAVFT
jgi:hypothetical protein